MGRPRKYNTEEERIAANRERAYLRYQRLKDTEEYKAAQRVRGLRSYHKHKNDDEYMERRRASRLRSYYRHKDEEEYKAARKASEKRYRDKHKDERAEYRSTLKGRANSLLGGYRQADKNQNRGECTIDSQWIVDNVFSGQCCHYCGESDWAKLGVDRKDSSLPHTPENCVPCCKHCNDMKGTTEYSEFMKLIGKIF